MSDIAPLECDLYVEDHGSVILFRPVSRGAREWLDKNVSEDAQWFGGALAVEHRYAESLADGMTDAGLLLK